MEVSEIVEGAVNVLLSPALPLSQQDKKRFVRRKGQGFYLEQALSVKWKKAASSSAFWKNFNIIELF